MILLDENWPEQQRHIMIKAASGIHQVGTEWGQKGMSDSEILAALRRQKRVTFLTRDADFYKRANCHGSYCLVLLQVTRREAAAYAIRFLRHPLFRTFANRQGKVVRVQPTGITYWQKHAAREVEIPWS